MLLPKNYETMKNLKFVCITILALIILSCKKEKQHEITCKVTALKTGTDSVLFRYNTVGNIDFIKTINSPDTTNMSFTNESGFYKEVITKNSNTTPNYTIYYKLNTNGNLDNFQLTISTPAIYINYIRCKYDNDGHLILQEVKTTKSGSPYSFKKDSSIYENGNLTKLYRFQSIIGDTTTALLNSTTLINYTSLSNTAGWYINQMYAPNNIQGTSTAELNNFPYLYHLLGKGSTNLPLNSSTSYSSGAGSISYTYDYLTDAENKVSSQTISRTPLGFGFPKINRFYYTCN